MVYRTGRKIRAILTALLGLCLLFGAPVAQAQRAQEQSMALTGQISDDGKRIGLIWDARELPAGATTTVSRRILGDTGKHSWRPIAENLGDVPRFLDRNVSPGTAYEYQVHRSVDDRVDVGYWVSGTKVPAMEKHGKVLLVIDQTIAVDLKLHLNRFEFDLIGEGWSVERQLVPRGDKRDAIRNLKQAREVRNWIKDRYTSDPFTTHTLILIGHVPGVKSGNSRPDGHGRSALHTDLFYADANGVWPDDGGGTLLPNRVPSSHIEMQVGRIDFSDLGGEFPDEMTLLKNYFDKNHQWRHGRIGDLRNGYAGKNHLIVEHNGLRNVLGPRALVVGGHHDEGIQHPWLFGVDFGDWKIEPYYSGPAIQPVFAINFGSGKHLIGRGNNIVTATLAQPWYTLAVGWGGRPAWQLHTMSLGNSIGYAHFRTVNNGLISQGGKNSFEYVPTGQYTWLNPIWVNLLGDPTLRPFNLPSPDRLEVSAANIGNKITWSAISSSADILGYKVYRAETERGPYSALGPAAPINTTEFLDEVGTPTSVYMVRAYGEQRVPAGSFYSYSTGSFSQMKNTAPLATDEVHQMSINETLTFVPEVADENSDDQLLVSFVQRPSSGQLERAGEAWRFTPEPDMSGEVVIPFTIFDGLTTSHGQTEFHIK